MRFVFHGSANEVGRSCIEVDFESAGKERRILLDAGFKIHGGEPLLPTTVSNIDKVDAVFITHSHMDHIGALPYFHHYGLNSPIFMTGMTKKLSKIMLDDSLHLELLRHHHPAYDNYDLNEILGNSVIIKYYHMMKFHDAEFEFIPSGHIPGSASVILKIGEKTILYTGDIQTLDSHLVHGLSTDFLSRHKIDIMISESTYGNRERKNRSVEEKKFIASVRKTIKRGGSVLLPAFAIGRAQEILMILAEETRSLGVPIYLDGMAKKVLNALLGNDIHIRNADKLRDALSNVEFVAKNSQRHKILEEQCVIVTTSGMVSGGPVMEYLKHFWHNPKDSILLTGFQAEGTNGRMLLESKQAYIDGHMISFKPEISNFDFSGHAGRKDILGLIKKASPEILIINHGSPEASAALAEDAKAFSKKVIVPHVGSTLIF